MKSEQTKVSRRALAGLFPVAAALPLNSQAPPSTPAGFAQQVRDAQKRNREAVNKVKIPMATEPAFRYQA